MQGELFLFLIVLVLGCAALLFGVFCVVGRAISWIFEGVVRLVSGKPGESKAIHRRASPRSSRACPRPECGQVERRPARFCAQCGTPLGTDRPAPTPEEEGPATVAPQGMGRTNNV